MKTPEEKDELFTDLDEKKEQLMVNAAFTLAELTDAVVFSLPIATQNRIADTIEKGGQLAVLTVLTPSPTFVVMLLAGPNTGPVEICRCAPPVEALVCRETVSH
jgi:hypothetical protein